MAKQVGTAIIQDLLLCRRPAPEKLPRNCHWSQRTEMALAGPALACAASPQLPAVLQLQTCSKVQTEVLEGLFCCDLY